MYGNVCVLLYQLRSAFSFITVSAEFFCGPNSFIGFNGVKLQADLATCLCISL